MPAVRRQKPRRLPCTYGAGKSREAPAFVISRQAEGGRAKRPLARVLSFDADVFCPSTFFLAMRSTKRMAPDRAARPPRSKKAEVFREAVREGAWDWTRTPIESGRYNSEGTALLCQALARGLSPLRLRELGRRIEEEGLDGQAVARLVLGYALDEMTRQMWVGLTPGQTLRRRRGDELLEERLAAEGGSRVEHSDAVARATGVERRALLARAKRRDYEARYQEENGSRRRR